MSSQWIANAWSGAPIVRCPSCRHRFHFRAGDSGTTLENVGVVTHCPKCHARIECVEARVSVDWNWAVFAPDGENNER